MWSTIINLVDTYKSLALSEIAAVIFYDGTGSHLRGVSAKNSSPTRNVSNEATR